MTDGGKLAESWRRIAEEGRTLAPWQPEYRIPWDDPELSRRFLDVHLDQDSHMASRTREVIDAHVDWLVELCRAGGRGETLRVLDLTCGPGLYCHALARRGHEAHGIDVAPAAIDHARAEAAREGLDCRFVLGDVFDERAYEDEAFRDLDAIMLWFGEFNAFPPDRVAPLLALCAGRLAPGGLLAIEYQPESIFQREDVREWRAVDRSVFRDRPHLWLQDYRWDEATRSEMTVHWILDTIGGDLERYVQCHRAWREDELSGMIADAGLEPPAFLPPITGCDERFEFSMMVAARPEDPARPG